MRLMKRIILLLVLVAALLSACTQPQKPSTNPSSTPTQPTTAPTTAPTEPTVPQIDAVFSGPVTLTNVGTFKHSSSLLFAYGDFVLHYDQEVPEAPYQLLSPLGQAQLPGHYTAAAYFGNGIAMVSDSDGAVGLLDYRNGIELAPCEATHIKQLNAQYFLLMYADGSLKVVDALAGSFVPNVVLDSMPDDVGVWGSRFYLRRGDVTEVYNADGTLASSLENVTVVDNIGIQPAFGGVNIYGGDMELISQLKHASQRLDLLEGGYLRFYDEGEYMVLDLMGQPVSQDRYQQIQSVADGCIIARKESGWGMTGTAGQQVLPFVYASIQTLGDGLFLLEEQEGRFMRFDVAGHIANVTELSGSDGYFYSETETGRSYLLGNGGRLQLEGEVQEMGFGLISTADGVYELHTGGLLLEGYDRYAYCDGYVYARMHGIWTVFQVEVSS